MLLFMQELFTSFATLLMRVLPRSPFDQYISAFGDFKYLNWLNWFIPVRACLIIFSSWLTCVSLFYLYSIIMRWIKMIGD